MQYQEGTLMPTWELTGYDTDSRNDRCREYTSSEKLAKAWAMIPRIQFADSGHGIVFCARELRPGEKRKPKISRMEWADGFLRDPAKAWSEHYAAEQQRQRARLKRLDDELADLRERLAEAEAFAKEGWDWLDDALRAGGWKDVFAIPKETHSAF